MATPPAPARRPTWRYTDTLIVFLAGLVGGIVTGIIAFAVTGDENIGSVWLFWLVLPGQFLATFLALAYVSRRRGTGSWEADFGFKLDPKDFWYLGVGMVVLVGTGLAAEGVRILLGLTDDNPQALIDIVDTVGTGPTVFAMVASLAIAGPIAEELTYRGLLLKTLLERGGEGRAIVLSALVFSLVHVTDPALASLNGVPTLVALTLMGLILGWVTVRAGNLSRAIFIHGGFNLLTTLTLLFADVSVTEPEVVEESLGLFHLLR